MANNKVQLADGTVLIDLTDTTTTAADVAAGKFFYTAGGVRTEGTATIGGLSVSVEQLPNGGEHYIISGEGGGGSVEPQFATLRVINNRASTSSSSLMSTVHMQNYSYDSTTGQIVAENVNTPKNTTMDYAIPYGPSSLTFCIRTSASAPAPVVTSDYVIMLGHLIHTSASSIRYTFCKFTDSVSALPSPIIITVTDEA